MATPLYAAQHEFPGSYQGDTYVGYEYEFAELLDTGSAPWSLAGSSIRSQLRSGGGVLLYEWSTAAGTVTITGDAEHIVRFAAVPPETTALWPAGRHRREIEITSADGIRLTRVTGTQTVTEDSTQ